MTSSKKYITGCKRLKLIQDYLAGREDDNYEVLPTRKEGKYIVRARTEPLTKKDDKDKAEVEDNNALVSNTDAVEEVNDNNDAPTTPIKQPPPKRITQTSPQQFVAAGPRCLHQMEDPTINLEILNQLKSLGDELRAEREAKQQKKLIKATARKVFLESNPQGLAVKQQIYKHSNLQPPTNQTDDEEEVVQQPIIPPRPSISRRRVNLLQK